MIKRILVIDDDAQIRAVASASLSLVGEWEVLTAPSGPEGIAAAEADLPDVILLDVMMPDMDGPTTLKVLREIPATADIPVIMLTAAAGASGGDVLAGLAVTAVIAKPFDIMGLAGQIASALGWEL